jgi:hypothetical protein
MIAMGPVATRSRRAATTALTVLVATCVVACGRDAADGDAAEGAVLRIGTGEDAVRVDVEIADSSAERATGLMGRSDLAPGAGMVFLWEEPVRTTFWMKDTLIPLSIAFWDERRRIVSILDMAPCRAGPCPVYDPEVPFVGAVEVNAGFFDRQGVSVGDAVELVGQPA